MSSFCRNCATGGSHNLCFLCSWSVFAKQALWIFKILIIYTFTCNLYLCTPHGAKFQQQKPSNTRFVHRCKTKQSIARPTRLNFNKLEPFSASMVLICESQLSYVCFQIKHMIYITAIHTTTHIHRGHRRALSHLCKRYHATKAKCQHSRTL